jgi:hypothetical protein
MATLHTHTGHCQACGRQQAVDNALGTLAKHGYKVAGFGFFMGTCQGSGRRPLELERAFLDTICAALAEYSARMSTRSMQLLKREVVLEQATRLDNYGGRVTERVKTGRRDRYGREKTENREVRVPWVEASPSERGAELKREVALADSEASEADQHREGLLRLAKEVHGRPLAAVSRARRVDVGTRVKWGAAVVEVLRLEHRVARGVGPYHNGRSVEHAVFVSPLTGKEHAYPTRFLKVAP